MFTKFLKKYHLSTLRLFALHTAMDKELYYNKIKIDLDVVKVSDTNMELDFKCMDDLEVELYDEIFNKAWEKTRKLQNLILLGFALAFLIPLSFFFIHIFPYHNHIAMNIKFSVAFFYYFLPLVAIVIAWRLWDIKRYELFDKYLNKQIAIFKKQMLEDIKKYLKANKDKE